jgi:hypothetical protein
MPEGWLLVGMVLIGLLGGLLGGFLGIGGSVLIIPGMLLLAGLNYHTAQAAALIVNVLVGSSAVRAHLKSGKVKGGMLRVLIPASLVMAVVGVLVSNQFTDETGQIWLRRMFGLAMLYVWAVNAMRLVRTLIWTGRAPWTNASERLHPFRVASVGALAGFSSGLLGLGGGSVAVPAQQVLLGIRLRTAAANSCLVVVFSSALAAIMKHVTLPAEASRVQSWIYVGILAPTAILGGFIGSRITHNVPRMWVRVIFLAFLTWTIYKMLLG